MKDSCVVTFRKIFTKVYSAGIGVLQQLFPFTASEYFAFIDYVGLVCDRQRIANVVVREEYADSLARQFLDQFLDFIDSLRIDSRKRFIKQEELGIAAEASCYLRPAPFTPTEGIAVLLPDTGYAEFLKEVLDDRLLDRKSVV